MYHEKLKLGIMLVILSVIFVSCAPALSPEEEQAHTSTASWQATWTAVAYQIDPDLLEIIQAVSPIIRGEGVANAGEYDPSVSWPHKLIIIYEDGVPYWEVETLPAKWLPTVLTETELVVILGQEEQKVIDTEDYFSESGSGKVTLKRLQYQCSISVWEARTGLYIDDGIVNGSEPPGFPYQIQVDSLGYVRHPRGNRVSPEDIQNWLLCKFDKENCPEP
jgi:hypothetical protein